MANIPLQVVADPASAGVFLGVNAAAMRPPPQFTPPFAATDLEPQAIWRIGWLYDPYFYLAFLPRDHRFPSIFSVLDMMPGTVPVENVVDGRGRTTYRLQPQKVEEFMSLYNTAYNIRIFFCNYARFSRSAPFTPGDTVFSAFGVNEDKLRASQSSSRAVVATTLCARDSIMANFAWISYAVAWHTLATDTQPYWYLSLLNKNTVPPPILRALQATWVFDLHATRIGGLVPVTLPLQYDRASWGAASTTWITNLHHIILTVPGIPYWLHYPHPVNPQMPKTWKEARYWQPTDTIVQAARQGHTVITGVPLPSNQTSQRQPETRPAPANHQNASIPWPKFKQGLDTWLHQKRLTGSAKDQVVWQGRECEALRLTPWEMNADKPIWKRWVVWIWEDNGDGTWSHHTRSTAQGSLEEDWTRLSSSQRFIDPINCTWHVSHYFPADENQNPEYPEDAEVSDQGLLHAEASDHPRLSSSSRSRARSRSPAPASSQRTRSPVRPRSPSPKPIQQILTPQTTLYHHNLPETLLGCIRSRFGIPEEAQPLVVSPRRIPTNVLKAVFGYQEEWHGTLSVTDWELLGDLFGGHAKGRPEVDPNSTEWQTVAQSLSHICDIFPCSIFPHPYNLHRSSYSVIRLDVPKDHARQIDAHTAYLLLPADTQIQDHPWLVCIEDALSVLQVMRSDWGAEPLRLACTLAIRGIPFRTLRLSKINTPHTTNNRSRSGLQLLPKGYIPTPQDYIAYTLLLRDLIHGCQGRPALLKGGILWRLAMEILGEEDLWAVQIQSVPLDCREQYFLAKYEDYSGVDDELTQQEEDMICGVYRILSDTNSTEIKGKNAAAVSWWPKQDLWNHPACEWNKGYWTWENELWFRKRREGIMAGTAKAMTVKEWEFSLRQGRWKKSLNNLQKVGALRLQLVQK